MSFRILDEEDKFKCRMHNTRTQLFMLSQFFSHQQDAFEIYENLCHSKISHYTVTNLRGGSMRAIGNRKRGSQYYIASLKIQFTSSYSY